MHKVLQNIKIHEYKENKLPSSYVKDLSPKAQAFMNI